MSSADQYLRAIVHKYRVDNGAFSPVRSVVPFLLPSLRTWGGAFLEGVMPSGSFAKGTAVNISTDIDLFLSLSPATPDTLKVIYQTLFNRLSSDGFSPKCQNVSVGAIVNGYSVDLVPARRINLQSHDHSLYKQKQDTWTKTNINRHIQRIVTSNRTDEIVVMKIWSKQHLLDIPSFYLEMLTIEACKNRPYGNLSSNISACFEYVRDYIVSARFIDPSNTANAISDDLTIEEKKKLAAAAAQARNTRLWIDIVK